MSMQHTFIYWFKHIPMSPACLRYSDTLLLSNSTYYEATDVFLKIYCFMTWDEYATFLNYIEMDPRPDPPWAISTLM